MKKHYSFNCKLHANTIILGYYGCWTFTVNFADLTRAQTYREGHGVESGYLG